MLYLISYLTFKFNSEFSYVFVYHTESPKLALSALVQVKLNKFPLVLLNVNLIIKPWVLWNS